jgi:hypothetical protein
MRRFTKKRVIGALSLIAVLALAGGAFAYFTSTGTGTGNATVGSSSTYTVTVGAPTGGTLYPGSGTDTVSIDVHNNSSGNQQVSNVAASLTANGSGDVYNANTSAYATGCKASWFTVTPSETGLPADLNGGGDYTTSATISMQDSNTNQNACQGVAPQVTVSAG